MDRAVDICGKKKCDAARRGQALFALAKVLAATKGDTGRAVELAQQAREIFSKTPKAVKKELEEINAWLREHSDS